jgi:hypothetical protein
VSYGDSVDLGVESLLGPDAAEPAQILRDRLALASRYLANWYKATKGSDNKAVWWQRIDAERAKVEAAYSEYSKPENLTFGGRTASALYLNAAQDWPQLWRDLKLSPDTLVEQSLIDSVADVFTAPFSVLPTMGNEIGKAIGGALGGLVRQLFPWLLAAGAVGLVYVFRAPLARAASQVAK